MRSDSTVIEEHQVERVKVIICRDALRTIFDECDKYDCDETGGRVVGTYQLGGGLLTLEVTGVIEPGPKAKRTGTSFFQDGEYQSQVFRTIEYEHPMIEHLGNWHTHHVNGYPTLSEGDKATYTRVVNHRNHNTDFLYALLIVAKNSTSKGDARYSVKHYILFRGQPDVFEIQPSRIRIVDKPIVWPRVHGETRPEVLVNRSVPQFGAHIERANDKAALNEYYPEVQPYFSKQTGLLYWKGQIELIDDSRVTILAPETEESGRARYSITIVGSPSAYQRILRDYEGRTFTSARKAIRSIERDINREIYARALGKSSQ